ncbi:MAG: peptidoglycan DD-metalloendopeptidase family protein [Ferruginibacter sp.]
MNVLVKYRNDFHRVVDFNTAKDKLYHFDFTAANHELTDALVADTKRFSTYINSKLDNGKYKYGIGGYNENRVLYKRSSHFNTKSSLEAPSKGRDLGEARTIHLGIDIWGDAGTKIYAPLGGMVHSTGFNNNFGDYGATIILQHQLDTAVFHTLYGHVSLKDIETLEQGNYISRGQQFARFGEPHENGDWPPHLHFQVIQFMELKEGDYPGVCAKSEREKYLANCPDPNLILKML